MSNNKMAGIEAALAAVPRSNFVAVPDLRNLISGRSIPTQAVVRSILERTPEIRPADRVLQIGSGTGYLSAVLATLAAKVVVVERHEAMAAMAEANLERVGIKGIAFLPGQGEDGAEMLGPFERIISLCFLKQLDRLLAQLAPSGSLVCLEGTDRLMPNLLCYTRQNGNIVRNHPGPVNFRRDTGGILVDLGYIDGQGLESARRDAAKRKLPVLTVVAKSLNIDELNLYSSLARQHNLRFASADELLSALDPKLFQRFSTTFMDNQRLIPVCVRNGQLHVATDNPDVPTDDIGRMHDYSETVKILVTPTDFRRLWSSVDLTRRGIQQLEWTEHTEETPDVEDLLDSSSRQFTHYLVSVYEAILLDAVSARASDIHVERYHDRIRIRLRSDGELHDLDHYHLTPRDHAGLINIIKVRAQIDIAERRLPQGGRMQMRVGSTNYDLRVQIQPSLHGEHAVIRLLSQTGRVLGLQELGMSTRIGAHYQRLLHNPTGLVLVVGPTGSGKSTTLYAGLQELADDGRRKVITVEDPIEYSIDNVQQTRARPEIGFNFADAMRSFVRQDPDVVLVGEIRDTETALESVRASQTGHLVLSTLHSNDAVDALQRLYDLGILPNSIAGELLAVIAQRLAKRICPNCREPVDPDPNILRELFPDRIPKGFRCFLGKGCKECGERGTRGRVAVVEYLHANDDIRNAISTRPPVGELRWRALDAGLITMRDSALDHVIDGVIPLSELPRILPQERMAPENRGGIRQI